MEIILLEMFLNEIWNPGNFPEGYKPLDFVKKNLPSILRNPLIVNILFLSEDVEKWGFRAFQNL